VVFGLGDGLGCCEAFCLKKSWYGFNTVMELLVMKMGLILWLLEQYRFFWFLT
jgi:hypothetical protein